MDAENDLCSKTARRISHAASSFHAGFIKYPFIQPKMVGLLWSSEDHSSLSRVHRNAPRRQYSLVGLTIKMEELPSGHEYADIVYLPRQGETVPALIVELKWNQSADSAIDQIRQRKYPTVLLNWGGPILLVGISFNKDAPAGRRHYSCRIEPWQT